MPRAPLAAAALALAALPAARGIELSVCEESWRCKFEHVLGDATYRWDLNPLCRPAGGYVYGGDDNAATVGQTFAWNICGNSSQACSDYTKADAEYESHGAAVQFMQRGRGERTNGGCLRPDNTTCADYTFGGTTCCSTRRCEVVAYNLFTFDVVAPANPAAGGIVLRYSGYPDRNDDNIACPDQANGLRRLRTFILNLDCDPLGTVDNLVVTSYNENSPYCTFRVRAKTRAACGVADAPAAAAAAPAATPGANFGFTILGSVLTVGGYAAFLFADSRGYFDSLRARLPSSWRGGGYTPAATPASSSNYVRTGGAYGAA